MSAGKPGFLVALLIVALSGCSAISEPVDVERSVTPEQSDQSTSANPSAQDPQNIFTGTRADYASNLAECMADKGWDFEMNPDGQGFSVNPPPEQIEAVNADFEDCSTQFGTLDMGFDDPERLREYYDVQVERVTCLNEAGWDLPSPPSFASVQDEYLVEGYISWTATSGIAPQDIQRAEQLCPDSSDF